MPTKDILSNNTEDLSSKEDENTYDKDAMLEDYLVVDEHENNTTKMSIAIALSEKDKDVTSIPKKEAQI